MNKRRSIDLAIALVCLAVFIITCVYSNQIRIYKIILWLSGLSIFLFFLAAVLEKPAKKRFDTAKRKIRELVLLSEEDTELCVWDIYGKTAVVIGRDERENQVDIDLNTSSYASMVEIEHAVMNFSSGNWYIEDLGSKNGIRIKKEGDKKIYQLSSNTPCKVDCGDILYIGFNRLLLRD